MQTHRLPEWPFKAVCVRPLIVSPVHIGPVGPVPTCLPLCLRWPSSPRSAVWWAWPPTLAEFSLSNSISEALKDAASLQAHWRLFINLHLLPQQFHICQICYLVMMQFVEKRSWKLYVPSCSVDAFNSCCDIISTCIPHRKKSDFRNKKGDQKCCTACLWVLTCITYSVRVSFHTKKRTIFILEDQTCSFFPPINNSLSWGPHMCVAVVWGVDCIFYVFDHTVKAVVIFLRSHLFTCWRSITPGEPGSSPLAKGHTFFFIKKWIPLEQHTAVLFNGF